MFQNRREGTNCNKIILSGDKLMLQTWASVSRDHMTVLNFKLTSIDYSSRAGVLNETSYLEEIVLPFEVNSVQSRFFQVMECPRNGFGSCWVILGWL